MPDLTPAAGDSDFYFVPAEDPETAVQRILELVKTRIPKRFDLDLPSATSKCSAR
jgi:exodeoxyribonuclease V alpha subunit